MITAGCRALRSWVKSPGHSSAEVGRALGVSGPAVSAWFRGVARPEQHHRLALEQLTGIPAGDWVTPAERKALADSLRRIERRTGTAG